ncbi:MAG: hypothetical protein EAZ65_06280 [Verrucomicrobia bacterium]|nr:MAG: hypothetical protein EAZ84_11720 [Verrucomicrobiota bacterium]TAE87671.1 MAG: hypothetical protein EAZ82_06855 [Verrucomicrobiota bacterium]TAF25394.1 MAG: hypothetical protein EAZ71_07890 [Verrucomicrobiota bacterium]TAF41181.1 MAG: hypothetical protein EAZ65_06280 [Verrucomicrobiota bacterium]
MPDEQSLQSARRDRSIRLAVVTSFASKAGNALLQLLAIPVAVRVLGREEFGIYGTVGIALSIVAVLQAGIGPALAHGIASAKARGGDAEAREWSSSAFFLSGGLALLAGLLLSALLLLLPLPWIFGEEFAGREDALRWGLWTGLLLFVLLFLLNLGDRLREGLLEVSSNNLWGAAGNLAAALMVGIGVHLVPEVWFLVLAVHGPLVLAKLCNLLSLWRHHPELRPLRSFFRPSVAKGLFTDGLAFSSCALVAGVVECNLCGWLVGRSGGPSASALYSVFIQMTIMQLGLVMMLSTPTWPAVAEALARGDLAWAKRAAGRLYRYGGAFGLCAFAGLVLLGPWFFRFWLGAEFSGLPRSTFAGYGFYFAAHVWRHLNHTMMIATGQVRFLARIQFAESVLVAGVALLALKWGGMGSMFAAMATTILVVSGTILPWRVMRGMLGRA